MRTQLESQIDLLERAKKDPVFAIKQYLDSTINDECISLFNKVLEHKKPIITSDTESIFAMYMYLLYRYMFTPPVSILYFNENKDFAFFTKDIFERGIRNSKVPVQPFFTVNTQQRIVSNSGSKFLSAYNFSQLCGNNFDIAVIPREQAIALESQLIPINPQMKILITEVEDE